MAIIVNNIVAYYLKLRAGMVVHTFIPSIWEAEVVRCLWVQEQPALLNEFQDSHGYIKRPWLKKQQPKTERGFEEKKKG